MPFVSLNDESGDVPWFNYWVLNNILIVKIEPFDSMEKVDDLLRFLLLGRFIFFGWPILKLERLPIRKQTHDSSPFFFGKAIGRIVDFESYQIISDFASHCLFVFVFFSFILSGENLFYFFTFCLKVLSSFQKHLCIFEWNISFDVCCWHHNDWLAWGSGAHLKNLF